MQIISEYLIKHDVDILFCNYNIKHNDKIFTIKSDMISPDIAINKIDKIIKYGILNNCWNKVYNSDFIKRQNIYFSGLIYAEDFDWVLELLLRNPKIDYCDVSIINYIRRKDSITNALNLNKELNKITFCKKWYQKLPKNKNTTNYLAWLYLSSIFNYYKFSKSDKLKLKDAFSLRFECLKESTAFRVKNAYLMIKIVGYNIFSRLYNFLKALLKRKIKYE